MSPVSAGVAGWQAVADQLAAGGDAELGERLAQVIVDRARAQEQLRRDLLVGQALGDKACDLQLLWRQLFYRGHVPLARRLSRRPQLRLSPLRPRHRTYRAEYFQCSTQMTARIGTPSL